MSKAITALWCTLAVPTAFALQTQLPTQPASDLAPAPLPTSQASRRPQGPLAPISGTTRDGSASVKLVPDDAPAPVEHPAALDDSIPLPTPAVMQTGADGDAQVTPASGDPFFLGFAAGKYYPPSDEQVDPLLYANSLPNYTDGRPEPVTYAFAMFKQRITSDRIARLEAMGARVLGFHPHYTMKVALPVGAIDQIANDPSIRWLGLPRAWQKVHPALSNQIAVADPNKPVDVWIDVFESDLGPQSRELMDSGASYGGPDGTVGHSDPAPLSGVWTTNGWMQHQLESLGVEVIHYSESIQAFRCRMMPQSLEQIAALDFVQFVEYRAPEQPMHDESMPMVNADDVRLFYDGNTNSRSVGGIVDTGVETAHADLNHVWWVAWDDSGGTGGGDDDMCGHGSHVAGTILGDGSSDASKTGASPDLGWGGAGRFFMVRVFATCAGQSVDVATNLSHTSQAFNDGTNTTPAPHVTNNSWGTGGNSSSPWIGSEADPRAYDSNAYSGAQINVFAAGNAGPTASTIGEEASAKNVITVGNVIDYNDSVDGLPGGLWTGFGGSSQGPCGDGRWKPSVCAPGRWIESVDGFTSNGYTYKYGTSMAAPHVTGTIADLIDANSMWAYLPERVAAQLMATAYRRNDVALTSPTDSHLDQYGAGRIDGTRSIWTTSAETWTSWAFTLSSGSSTNADFTVPVGATRLVAVMNYSDPASSAGASQALVNNWDLYLDQPPIQAGDNTGDWFVQQSSIDNTEIRVLSNPIDGVWKWKVWPTSTSSTAYFGVTIFVQTQDTSPDVTIDVTASSTLVHPGDSVVIGANVDTPTTSAASVFLDSSSSGNTLSQAGTFLRDGTLSDLLDNEHLGRDLELGNLSPFFGRSAQWTTSWSTDGIKSFSVTARGDNFADAADSVFVTVDGTAPGLPTNLHSTSHTINVWSNDGTIDFAWTAATDNLSGVDGYGISWGSAPGVFVANAKDIEEAPLTYTTPVIGDTATRYFAMKTVDNAVNWTAGTAEVGPYKIDTVNPIGPTGLTSSTHTVNVQSCATNVTMNWTAGSDALSGLAGYIGLWDTAAGTNPVGATNIGAGATSFAQNIGSSTTPRYFHLRARDNAGNYGTTQHFGPVLANSASVVVYCTGKTNSLGCVPAIGTNGVQPDKSNGNFQVTCTNVINQKNGLIFWGFTPSAVPFQGGIKCAASPTVRGPILNSGGPVMGSSCTGSYMHQFTTAYMNSYGLDPGETVYCQFWMRDPGSPSTTGLSNALRFTICQ